MNGKLRRLGTLWVSIELVQDYYRENEFRQHLGLLSYRMLQTHSIKDNFAPQDYGYQRGFVNDNAYSIKEHHDVIYQLLRERAPAQIFYVIFLT